MVWCGVVWCGVVWCGVVWCGVVWCGADQSVLRSRFRIGSRCLLTLYFRLACMWVHAREGWSATDSTEVEAHARTRTSTRTHPRVHARTKSFSRFSLVSANIVLPSSVTVTKPDSGFAVSSPSSLAGCGGGVVVWCGVVVVWWCVVVWCGVVRGVVSRGVAWCGVWCGEPW